MSLSWGGHNPCPVLMELVWNEIGTLRLFESTSAARVPLKQLGETSSLEDDILIHDVLTFFVHLYSANFFGNSITLQKCKR